MKNKVPLQTIPFGFLEVGKRYITISGKIRKIACLREQYMCDKYTFVDCQGRLYDITGESYIDNQCNLIALIVEEPKVKQESIMQAYEARSRTNIANKEGITFIIASIEIATNKG